MKKIFLWCKSLFKKQPHHEQTITFKERNVSVTARYDKTDEYLCKTKRLIGLRFDGEYLYADVKCNGRVLSINLDDVRSIAIWDDHRVGLYIKSPEQ